MRYDSQDPYRSCSALTIIENPGNKLLDQRGGLLAGGSAGGQTLALNLLGDDPSRSGERLDEVGSESEIEEDAVRMQDDARYANRVYGRAVDRDGKTYLQYWFWFYYNPKDVLGRGRHEGDWEMIQLTLEGERPTCAVYAQHNHSHKEEWGSVRRHPPGGQHPVVYVAAESHASYFQDGTHPSFGRADNAYGDGAEALPDVEEFGGWERWHGRWGNSRGLPIIRRLAVGKSPQGPGRQNPKWDDPPRFEQSARTNQDKEHGWLWRFGLKTYPLKPEILEAHLSGNRVTIRYRTHSTLFRRRARHLLVTVNAPDENGDVLGRETRARAPSEGQVEVTLVRAPDRAVALVSAFNRRRQRSDVARRALVPE
jgi:hypothetical protein